MKDFLQIAMWALCAVGVGVILGAMGSMLEAKSLASWAVAPGEFDRYRVTDPNTSEELRQSLYDHLLYAGAGQQVLNFFSTAIGAGLTTAPGSTAGNPKTIHDTNMQVANTLPSGKQYLIECIEVYFYPGTVSTANTFTPALVATASTAALAAGLVNAMNDVQAFYESGLLTLTILDKNQLQETPLRKFPPTNFLEAQASLAAADTNATTAIKLMTQHVRVGGVPYELAPKISLQPATNFTVSLSWPAAYAMPSGFNARVGITLDGIMQRAAQ
jgi:hypothetical protein